MRVRGAGSHLRVARTIAGALPVGVILFWTVAWFVTEGGQNGLAPEVLTQELALSIWAVIALSGFAAALWFRSKAVSLGGGSRSPAGPDEAAGAPEQVRAHLIVAWALLEGPALLAGVLFMVLASPLILSASAAVYGLGVAMTFPRAEWFPER